MNERPAPPSWSTKFLTWFLKGEYFEDIHGDLEEEYQLLIKSKGPNRAKRWYNWQIIKLFRPEMAKKIEAQNSIEKETTMFKNYFKIGLRNLWKYKSSTMINVIGLSIGIASFFLIAITIKYDLNFDLHFEDVDQIYRVTVKNYTTSGDLSRHWALASAGHADRIKADYSNVEYAARIYPWAYPDLIYREKVLPEEQVVFASDDIFKIFSFPFLEGSAENAFQDIYSLVMTESMAIKVFGNDWRDQSIIGSSIELSQRGEKAPFKVAGVIEDMPEQQHFKFDYLAPMRFLELAFSESAMNRVGGNYNWLTYLKVSEGTNVAALEREINDQFWDKYIGTYDDGTEARNFYDFYLQPILDIHLKSNLNGEIGKNSSLMLLQIFGVIGVLILLVACVNYMNIATSHYSRRMKEVGVRKVIGAFKTALVKQFLVESAMVTLISLPFCILLIIWAIPYLNSFLETNLVFDPLAQPEIMLPLVILLIVVGVVAGVYPALFLSRIDLIKALKGEQGINAKKWNFRAVLVAFQYIVTIGLIFSIVVIENQLQFIRNSDPGYEREHIIRMNLPRKFNRETFKNDLLANPNILKASYSSRIPTGRLNDTWGARYYQGDSLVEADFRLSVISVDLDFLDTYEIDLVSGENFREDMLTILNFDTVVQGHYIINRTAAKALGFNDPGEVIDEKMEYGVTEGRIIGVVEDFHFESLHQEIEPILFIYQENFRGLSVKINPQNVQASLNHVEEVFADYESVTRIDYNFVDDLFEQQYLKEKISSSLIKVFAAIAVLISCLGLIGMVGFIIETKIKEIGVRKVLGATASNIWRIIGQRFLILILVSSTISLPIMFYLMNGWLDGFQYRINISMFNIIIPTLAVLVITILTISFQVIKATRVNPVECLKDE